MKSKSVWLQKLFGSTASPEEQAVREALERAQHHPDEDFEGKRQRILELEQALAAWGGAVGVDDPDIRKLRTELTLECHALQRHAMIEGFLIPLRAAKHACIGSEWQTTLHQARLAIHRVEANADLMALLTKEERAGIHLDLKVARRLVDQSERHLNAPPPPPPPPPQRKPDAPPAPIAIPGRRPPDRA